MLATTFFKTLTKTFATLAKTLLTTQEVTLDRRVVTKGCKGCEGRSYVVDDVADDALAANNLTNLASKMTVTYV